MSFVYRADARAASPAPYRPGGVSGRDGYIIGEALVGFIMREQMKPPAEQTWSDLHDARSIYREYFGAMTVTLSADDERRPHHD
jgi:hypothetical protein